MGCNEGAPGVEQDLGDAGLGHVIERQLLAGTSGAGFDIGLDPGDFGVIGSGAGKTERGGQIEVTEGRRRWG